MVGVLPPVLEDARRCWRGLAKPFAEGWLSQRGDYSQCHGNPVGNGKQLAKPAGARNRIIVTPPKRRNPPLVPPSLQFVD